VEIGKPDTLPAKQHDERFAPRVVNGAMVVPIWKQFTSGPDKIVGYAPFDPAEPNARYSA